MLIQEFQVRRDDLAAARTASREAPALRPNEVLLRIDRFALTANNVTYGVVGERIGYWKFFPAADGYGIVPVWGYAKVVESANADIEPGERLYGFFPTATHLTMRAGRIREDRLVDESPHRAELPPVYNSYARVNAEADFDAALEDARPLLYPLYATSFCIADHLLDNAWFGADQIVIASASSKTAIGLAYALAAEKSAPRRIALTSERNAAFVRALKLYDDVAFYDDFDRIERRPTVIVDMSGNGAMLAALHRRLGDHMRRTANVGLTHYSAVSAEPGFIAERSGMFFAPAHIQKRAADWGPGVFEQKASKFFRDAAVKSRSWLALDRRPGFAAIEPAWREALSGAAAPAKGVIISV